MYGNIKSRGGCEPPRALLPKEQGGCSYLIAHMSRFVKQSMWFILFYGGRLTRWPDMQRGDVPVAHVLLVDRIERGLFEREGDFYETTVRGHNKKPTESSCLYNRSLETHLSLE